MITPQEIDTTYIQMGAEQNVVKIDGNYYYFKAMPKRSPFIDKITYILEGDELISEPGVYVYVIVGNPINNKPILFSKKVVSPQEIQTKHNDLLSDVHDKLGLDINSLYYAGEIIVEIHGDEIILKFNYLSGTYMIDIIDPDDPKENVQFVIDILQSELKNPNIIYEYVPGLQTFITSQRVPLTLSIIQDLLHSGANIYVIDEATQLQYGLNTIPKVKRIISDEYNYIAKKDTINRKYNALIKLPTNISKIPELEEQRLLELQKLEDTNLFNKVFVKLEPDMPDINFSYGLSYGVKKRSNSSKSVKKNKKRNKSIKRNKKLKKILK
jgi:hypothetical protein